MPSRPRWRKCRKRGAIALGGQLCQRSRSLLAPRFQGNEIHWCECVDWYRRDQYLVGFCRKKWKWRSCQCSLYTWYATLVWSSLGSTDAPSLGYSGAITVRLESSMPLGTDGMVVTNHGNSSRFVLGAPYTYNSITYSYAQLCDPSYPGFAGVTVLSGGG